MALDDAVGDNESDKTEIEAIRKQMDLLTLAEVELMSESKEKLIAKLKSSGVKISDPPEVVRINDTLTVVGAFRGERLNIAVGAVSDTKKFDTLTIGDRVVWLLKGEPLTRLKRKLLEEKKPKAKYRKPQQELVPEIGGLGKFVGLAEEAEEPKMDEKEEKPETPKKGKGEKIPLSDALQNRALKNMYGFEK